MGASLRPSSRQVWPPWKNGTDLHEGQTGRQIDIIELYMLDHPSFCSYIYPSYCLNVFLCVGLKCKWLMYINNWLLNLIYLVLCCADDLLWDVPRVWHGGSEWANLGPGASIPVEHFSLQRLDAHGSPWYLGIQTYKSHLDSLVVINQVQICKIAYNYIHDKCTWCKLCCCHFWQREKVF